MAKKPTLAPYGHTIGMPTARPNRNEATPNTPPAQTISQMGTGDRQTEAYTLFTLVGQQAGGSSSTPILYNADRNWAKVTLILETAGPVAVSTRADLFPVLSGKGELLQTGVPMVFTLGKGQSRLYYGANALNRIKVQIEPFAWMEQIVGNVEEIRQLLFSLAQRR